MPDRSRRPPLLLRRWHRLRRRRPGPPSQVTAIEVDGQVLRVVQSVPRGHQVTVTRLLAAGLELHADADRTDPLVMGSAIAKALAQAGIKPGSVVMGVPRAQVVLRTLTLPVIEDVRELASMVHFQISRDLPFRLEDAVVDFKVRRPANPEPAAIPNSPSLAPGEAGASDVKSEPAAATKLEVLVAAVPRDVVDFYRQTAELAGVRLGALGLLSYANVRCVEACHLADGDQAFALVSLRPDEVSIEVIAWQSLLFSRGAMIKLMPDPASAPALAEAPAADKPDALAAAEPPRPTSFAEAASIEVIRTLHSYSGMQSQNAATKVVVAGATGHEAAVVESLSKRLSIPCALLDPTAAFELPADAREHAPGSISVLGLALGLGDPKGLPFDFLHPKHPAIPRDMRRIRLLAGLSAAAAVLIFVLSIRGYLINQRERTRLDWVAQLADAEKKSPIYKRMLQQVLVVDDWAKGNENWIEHCAYLSALLPASEEIYLTSLSISPQGVIRMAVQARSGEILAKLDKQLRAAGYDVKPLAITPGADRHGYEFRSNVELIVPERLKIDLSKVKTPARPADDGSLDPALYKGGGGG